MFCIYWTFSYPEDIHLVYRIEWLIFPIRCLKFASYPTWTETVFQPMMGVPGILSLTFQITIANLHYSNNRVYDTSVSSYGGNQWKMNAQDISSKSVHAIAFTRNIYFSIKLRYTFNLKENTSSNIPILFLFVKSFVWMWVGHKRFQQQLQLIQSSSHNKAEEQMYSFSTWCERERGLVWIVKSNILNQSWRYSWDQ